MESELVDTAFLMEMGGEGSENSIASCYTDIFYENLPYYLAIGMPYDLYWEGNPNLVKVYREREDIKRTIENQKLYLQGYYFYEALLRSSPVINAFSKDPKPIPYLDNPIPLTEQEIREYERRKELNRIARLKAVMERWVVETADKKGGEIDE